MSSSNESNSKDAVLGASFTDVGVGPDAIHTVRVGGDAYTKLKSIKGVLIEDISIHTLRKWCTQHGFDGTRTLGKKAICDKIVAEKLRLDPSLVLLHFFSGDEPAVDGSKQESWVTDTLTKNQKAIEAVLSGYSIELRNQFKSLCDTACKELGIRDAGMTVLATRCAARSRNSETPSSNSSNPAHYAKWLIKLGEFFTLHESKWIADHGNKNRGPWRPVRDLYDAVSDAKLSIKSSEIFLSNFDYVYKDGTKGTDPPQNPIATGTFGRVYKVMEKGTGKLFAGKIFYPQKRGRFDVQKREVDIMKMMSKNPRLVKIHSSSFAMHFSYVAVDWIDGGTLQDYGDGEDIDFVKRMDQVPNLLRELTVGLVSLRIAKISHRDIKPDNILLLGGRIASPLLVDFGEANAGLVLKSVAGTPAYRPNEVRTQATYDGTAVDVFSVGKTAFAFLIGILYYEGKCDTGKADVQEILDDMKMEGIHHPLLNDKEPIRELLLLMTMEDPKDRPTLIDIFKHKSLCDIDPYESPELQSFKYEKQIVAQEYAALSKKDAKIKHLQEQNRQLKEQRNCNCRLEQDQPVICTDDSYSVVEHQGPNDGPTQTYSFASWPLLEMASKLSSHIAALDVIPLAILKSTAEIKMTSKVLSNHEVNLPVWLFYRCWKRYYEKGGPGLKIDMGVDPLTRIRFNVEKMAIFAKDSKNLAGVNKSVNKYVVDFHDLKKKLPDGNLLGDLDSSEYVSKTERVIIDTLDGLYTRLRDRGEDFTVRCQLEDIIVQSFEQAVGTAGLKFGRPFIELFADRLRDIYFYESDASGE